MAKKICWGLFAAVVILMGVRIIFVNVTYPDAIFKNMKESSELLYRDCRISIGDTTYYSKAEWKKYINGLGIQSEEEKNNIQYIKNAEGNKQRDYFVSYDPDDEYYVLTIDVTIKNESDEQTDCYYDELFNIVESKQADGEYFDKYYFNAVNETISGEKHEDSLNPGEERTVTYIYITNSEKERLYVQVIDIKGYQLFRLNIKNKK